MLDHSLQKLHHRRAVSTEITSEHLARRLIQRQPIRLRHLANIARLNPYPSFGNTE